MAHRPVARGLPPSIIIVVVVQETVFFLSLLKLLVQCGETVLLLVFLLFKPFLQAFQRRFARLFVVGLNVFEGGWDDLLFWVIIDTREITRMVVRVRKCRRGIDQAEVIWRKSVTHLTRPRVEGMALNAILHPDRADLFPKVLLGIANDLLRHFVSQGVFSLIVDGDASHPTLLFHGLTREDKRQEADALLRCQYIMP